ncbi:hypothetical protein ABW21_db0208000 [Orbilia brochopaga]|nr:hypothetical protein ABW21_db0208000 [Drechslerella brochopaga]
MYAPPGTKVGGVKPSKVENKDWIDEETAVKLLFRSGFIPLPTINLELGKIMVQASKCAGDYWSWANGADIIQWALRGGRMNGLVDLTNVRTLEDVESARIAQEEQFNIKHAQIIQQVRETLKDRPIDLEIAETIPEGQLYPKDHQATSVWYHYERKLHENLKMKDRTVEKRKQQLRHKIRHKLAQYQTILEEMKVTKAEIAMLESGKGEVWINPEFASLEKFEQVQLLEETGEFSPHDPDNREFRPKTTGPFRNFPPREYEGTPPPPPPTPPVEPRTWGFRKLADTDDYAKRYKDLLKHLAEKEELKSMLKPSPTSRKWDASQSRDSTVSAHGSGTMNFHGLPELDQAVWEETGAYKELESDLGEDRGQDRELETERRRWGQ